MRRIFFKDEMKAAILNGNKTATTRDHQKAHGEWEACTGSYYHAKPFAVINITENDLNTWAHSLEHWKDEGFDSLEDMHRFAYETGLNRYARVPALYFHQFVVVRQQEIITP